MQKQTFFCLAEAENNLILLSPILAVLPVRHYKYEYSFVGIGSASSYIDINSKKKNWKTPIDTIR